MASKMNSGGSNDINCIKIDPRTGEKFSFYVDIVAATAWQHPQQCTFIHAHESFQFHPMEAFLLLYCRLLNITSLSTNEIGCYLNYIQKQKSAAHGVIAWDHNDFLGRPSVP